MPVANIVVQSMLSSSGTRVREEYVPIAIQPIFVIHEFLVSSQT